MRSGRENVFKNGRIIRNILKSLQQPDQWDCYLCVAEIDTCVSFMVIQYTSENT